MIIYMFQKTATAVAYCKRGNGVLRVNGRPLDLVEPRILQYKLQEPILLLGKVSYYCIFLLFSFKYLLSCFNQDKQALKLMLLNTLLVGQICLHFNFHLCFLKKNGKVKKQK